MKYADTRASLDHYDDLPEPDERGEIRGLPENASPVHSLPMPLDPDARLRVSGRGIIFLDSWQYQRAACDRLIKVVLPMTFNDADPDSCEGCRVETGKWAIDAQAWWARRNRRDETRQRRKQEAEDSAVQRALEERRQAGDPD
jgi:hypothetical protein